MDFESSPSAARISDPAMYGAGLISRRDLFVGLAFLGCANGLAAKVIQVVSDIGWIEAFYTTTNVSIIVWASCFSGLALLFRDKSGPAGRLDFVIGAGFLAAVVLPVGGLSWAALTVLCAYIHSTSKCVAMRQGALILLATTAPMLWTPILFQLFANWLLAADAFLVSALLGTPRSGNVVEFADGSGQLVILHQCSSLANVSQAILCWITVSRSINHARSPWDVLWCAAACACVVAVNVVRMTLMGISGPVYEMVHGVAANAISSGIMLVLTISVCLLGVRRELFPRV